MRRFRPLRVLVKWELLYEALLALSLTLEAAFMEAFYYSP